MEKIIKESKMSNGDIYIGELYFKKYKKTGK